MTINSINSRLKEYGLNQRVSSIYIYLSQRIDSSAYYISKDLKIAKATVYNDLESMLDLGLVSKWKKNGKWYYTAESFGTQKNILEEKMKIIDSLIPEIKELRKYSSINPELKIYSGKKGVRIVFDQMLEQLKRKDVNDRLIFSHPSMTDLYPKYINDWAKKKKDLKIFTRCVAPMGLGLTSKTPEVYRSDEFREVRFIPEKYSHNISTSLDGDLFSLFIIEDGEIYSITITSPAIVSMFKKLFMFIWDHLEENPLK